MREVAIWDLSTRIFHWLLVVAVATAYITAEEQGILFVIHTLAGYMVVLLLTYRLIWGVIGSPRSRFADFVRGRTTLRAYGQALLRLEPPRFIGHNPFGGWMIVLMLAALAVTVCLGLLSGHRGGAGGLLLPLVFGAGAEGLGDLHGFFGNLVVILAGIHVCGVIGDWLLTRENLTRAMITGRKALSDPEAAAEPPLAPTWRTVVVALVVACLGAYLLSVTDFGQLATVAAEGAGDHHH